MILKQQKLLQLLVENGGKSASRKSLRQLILEAGYSESVANNPTKVVNSQSWQELMEQIPEATLLEKLLENAFQNKSITASNEAIDMLLKIKGRYAPAKFHLSNPYDEMSDEELEQRIAQKKQEIAEQEARTGNV